jgi:hypothetical protein
MMPKKKPFKRLGSAAALRSSNVPIETRMLYMSPAMRLDLGLVCFRKCDGHFSSDQDDGHDEIKL